MTESDVDAAVLKRTQQMLGKYVKKPALSEKLLRKPPFRFLHDVFNAVIKETGYFDGLYTAYELNFENIKDRDDKMNFLKKMIDVIKLTTGNAALNVRASKIVCGHEPEKTNELLQQIAEVIEKKLDWQNAVQQVKNSSSPTQSKDAPKVAEQSKETKRKVDKAKETKPKENKSNSKIISPNAAKEEKKPKRTTPTGAKDSQKGVKDAKDKEKVVKEKTNKTATTKEKTSKEMKTDAEKDKKKSKTKELKQKTPSPIAVDEVAKKKESTTTVKGIEAAVQPQPPAQSTAEQNEAPKMHNDEKQEKVEVANLSAQPMMEMKVEAPTQPIVQTAPAEVTDTISPIKSTENKRKSSGKRRTSGGSRRSSANKATREEFATPPETSLKLHEEGMVTSPTTTQPEPQRGSQPGPQPEPQPGPQPVQQPRPQATAAVAVATPTKKSVSSVINSNSPMQRESTFTRDDSNDANHQEPRPARTTLRPPSARPASARPGAPRKRNRNVEIVLQPNDEVKTDAGINVKLETFGDFGDDDVENLVIIDDGNNDNNQFNFGTSVESNANATAAVVAAANDDMQQGHLVQQILETQKELVQQTDNANELEKQQERNSAGTRQNAQQMDNLRDVIQNLTKAINPFGKLIDFLPEDIDAMQLEMGMWRDAFQQASAELKRERSLTESVTEPMKTQLTQIEANITEYSELIDGSRMKILQNSEKILKMLSE